MFEKLKNIVIVFIFILININIYSNDSNKYKYNYYNLNEINSINFSNNGNNFNRGKNPARLYNNLIIVGSVFSASSGIFITTGLILGFIPFNNSGESHMPHSVFQHDIYKTAIGSAGISCIITGAICFLFSLPLLIYGLVKRNRYLKEYKRTTKEFNFNINTGFIILKFG